jgi:hypothetical protein
MRDGKQELLQGLCRGGKRTCQVVIKTKYRCWKNIENKDQVNQKSSLRGLLVLLTMFSMSVQAQQLPQFSQYIFNGLHINPAYAGYKGDGYIQTTYRSQWVNFPGAPQTLSFTADISANEGSMGLGSLT